MTLLLSESETASLLSMKEVVPAIEESFRQQALGNSINTPRTKNYARGSRLSTMPGTLTYLGRAGVKSYISTRNGTAFLFTLFDASTNAPLAVMGAGYLGKYRTGAASAVATKFLSGLREFRFGVAGAGGQALTQVLALREVAELSRVSVWSRNKERRERLAKLLSKEYGLEASPVQEVGDAFRGSQVATTITSAVEPFVTEGAIADVRHMNVCGSNEPDHAELTPSAVAKFRSVCVDDLAESKIESGDLIMAMKSGDFSWDKAFELKDVVGGRVNPAPKTLFKSNGVAIEDVAVASLVYEKALKSGAEHNTFDFTE
ncbi:MAG: ornithine cyclodeaminase family protein [Thaumarchaeota archaeon]|nr:ornithine cyclodeaminase family protein [Nitrososphaerota archaeon]